MKILIVTDAWHPQLNGVVRTYEYLIQNLQIMGHDVKVISPSDFIGGLPMPGYKEIKLSLMPYPLMCRKVKDYNPDTIHIATEGTLGWTARRYCLKHNKKFTTCYHTQFPEYAAQRVAKHVPFLYKTTHRLSKEIIKKFHAPSSALLVTTDSMAEELKGWGIKTPIHRFTRGIDESVFHLKDKTLFQDLPKPIALYVGRLAIEKSVEEFLAMRWSGSKVVVGHGPDEKMLRKKYPTVHFVGKKTGKDLADHYCSADVFVFPSRTDTFGIVLIEALACGLPIAAHDVIGPRDVVTKDIFGAIHQDLSIAAQQALTKGTAQERNAHVQKHFTWTKSTEQFLNAVSKTVKRQDDNNHDSYSNCG